MSSLLKDLRFALRQFRRQPGFAAAVVSTLALAIGANTGVFLVVDAVLFRALPFASPEGLVYLTSVRSDHPAAPFSLPEFMDYREQARTQLTARQLARIRAERAGVVYNPPPLTFNFKQPLSTHGNGNKK